MATYVERIPASGTDQEPDADPSVGGETGRTGRGRGSFPSRGRLAFRYDRQHGVSGRHSA